MNVCVVCIYIFMYFHLTEAAAKQYAEDGLNRRSAIVPQQQQIHSTPTAANPVPSTQTAAAQQQKPTPPRSIGLTEEEKAQMRVAAYIGEVLKYNKLTPAQGYRYVCCVLVLATLYYVHVYVPLCLIHVNFHS